MMGKRLNYQSLYDDMIAQRNTALARVALLEDEIANYWEPANAAAITRAAAAEAALRELRENVMLGLGMAADDVAAVDDESADATISYLLSGHKELAAALRHMTEERDTISSAWDELAAERDALRAQLDAAGWQKCGYPDTPEEGENVVWSEADTATWPGQWVGHYNPRQADSFQGLWYLRLPAPPQE